MKAAIEAVSEVIASERSGGASPGQSHAERLFAFSRFAMRA
jgi:hypothetical protein